MCGDRKEGHVRLNEFQFFYRTDTKSTFDKSHVQNDYSHLTRQTEISNVVVCIVCYTRISVYNCICEHYYAITLLPVADPKMKENFLYSSHASGCHRTYSAMEINEI